MDKKIIVFDFDKTLTYKDTLLGFYIHISKSNYKKYFKLIIYCLVMLCHKLRIVSNDFLKKTGFFLFLKGLNKKYIEKMSLTYISKIKYNNLFKTFNFEDTSKKIVIISASYEVYLKYIFPKNVVVLGSIFEYKNSYASRFLINCFSTNKLKALDNISIKQIDDFYTDSFSDSSLSKLSDSTFIVKGDSIIKTKTFDEFKSFFYA